MNSVDHITSVKLNPLCFQCRIAFLCSSVSFNSKKCFSSFVSIRYSRRDPSHKSILVRRGSVFLLDTSDKRTTVAIDILAGIPVCPVV